MNNKSKKKIHRDFGESAKDHRDISKPKVLVLIKISQSKQKKAR